MLAIPVHRLTSNNLTFDAAFGIIEVFGEPSNIMSVIDTTIQNLEIKKYL